MDGVVELIEITQSKADAFITTCGARGRTGPTQEQCMAAYTSTASMRMMESVAAGIQTFVIPLKGTYTLTAYGARGGNARLDSTDFRGGQGAKVWGTFSLDKGDKVRVVVGQSGTKLEDGNSAVDLVSLGGAGGGGTFVWVTTADADPFGREREALPRPSFTTIVPRSPPPLPPPAEDVEEPLIVAGGGGGASYSRSEPGRVGMDTTAGSQGYSNGRLSAIAL